MRTLTLVKYNPALFDDTINQLISTTNGPIAQIFVIKMMDPLLSLT
jgi:hypothetical protein